MLENIWQVLSKYVVLRIMKPIELGVRNYQKGKILKYVSNLFTANKIEYYNRNKY